MKNFLNKSEKTRIKILYESKGIFLNEQWLGLLARGARKLAGKNSDDIANVLRTTEKELMTSMDDIISTAIKTKNIVQAEDIQIKLMHIFNPSGSPAGVATAKEEVKNFLNGYAKSKGKQNWVEIKDEIRGGVQSKANPQPQSQGRPYDDHVQMWVNPKGGLKGNPLSGNRISDRSFSENVKVDWSKITNAKNWKEYNQVIANAIKTNDYSKVSRGGLESLGITNFREFLMNNIEKINEVNPSYGRWSVNFTKFQ